MAVFDPVNGVDWGTKLDGNSFTYYLYQNGQTAGDPNIANVDDPSVPDATYTAVGWNNYEAGELRAALATYSAVANVTFTPTNSFSGSTLRMMLSKSTRGRLGSSYRREGAPLRDSAPSTSMARRGAARRPAARSSREATGSTRSCTNSVTRSG